MLLIFKFFIPHSEFRNPCLSGRQAQSEIKKIFTDPHIFSSLVWMVCKPSSCPSSHPEDSTSQWANPSFQ
jgi:hypothetical protein